MGVSFERKCALDGETFFGCNRLELELQNFGIPVKRNGTNLGSDRQTIEFEEEEI